MHIAKYRKHSSGKAFVEHEGKRHYLPGKYNSLESRRAYKNFVRHNLSIETTPQSLPDPQRLSIAGLVTEFLRWAKDYYPHNEGLNRGEYFNCRWALLPLVQAHGAEYANDWKPRDLIKWQSELEKEGTRSRSYINSMIAKVKRMFNWGVRSELISESTAGALAYVSALKSGRSKAPETMEKKPVPRSDFEEVKIEVSPLIADMLQIQDRTGVRPDSLCNARNQQFTRNPLSGLLDWRPKHKNEFRGHELVIAIDKICESILQRYLDSTDPEEYLFNPGKHYNRKSYGKKYTTCSYYTAINRAIDRINRKREKIAKENNSEPVLMEYWGPHQVRHLHGQDVFDKYESVEAVQAALGQKTIKASEIYSRNRRKLQTKIAQEAM
jgi:integrase